MSQSQAVQNSSSNQQAKQREQSIVAKSQKSKHSSGEERDSERGERDSLSKFKFGKELLEKRRGSDDSDSDWTDEDFDPKNLEKNNFGVEDDPENPHLKPNQDLSSGSEDEGPGPNGRLSSSSEDSFEEQEREVKMQQVLDLAVKEAK